MNQNDRREYLDTVLKGLKKSMTHICRICGTKLEEIFLDLGSSPLSNAFLTREQLNEPEVWYPLCVYRCRECGLVQLPAHATPEAIFARDYPYFSSYSASWVEHARRYAEMMIERFELGPDSLVVEIASNDGYLLQHFKARGIEVYGYEPAANVAEVAIKKGIPTFIDFFGRKLLEVVEISVNDKPKKANLICGANVLAHVPDLHDFVGGIAELLADDGVCTMEFPHLARLVEHCQFDTIYHEHFSYFTLATAMRAFNAHCLFVFDVEELPTHGGSLRVYADHGRQPSTDRLRDFILKYADRDEVGDLDGFRKRVQSIKNNLVEYLVNMKRRGVSVAGFGAPAKANTLLNYCGVRPDLLPYVVDDNPHKVGKFLPGSRIPVLHPDVLYREQPDEVLVMPWNLHTDLKRKLAANGYRGKVTSPVDLTKT